MFLSVRWLFCRDLPFHVAEVYSMLLTPRGSSVVIYVRKERSILCCVIAHKGRSPSVNACLRKSVLFPVHLFAAVRLFFDQTWSIVLGECKWFCYLQQSRSLFGSWHYWFVVLWLLFNFNLSRMGSTCLLICLTILSALNLVIVILDRNVLSSLFDMQQSLLLFLEFNQPFDSLSLLLLFSVYLSQVCLLFLLLPLFVKSYLIYPLSLD